MLLGIIGYEAYGYFTRKRAAVELTEEEFKKDMRKVQVIDVREKAEFDASHILGARNIPYSTFKTRYTEIRKDIPVYLQSILQKRQIKYEREELVLPDSFETINDYLVNVFNEILTIEETALQNSSFEDLSIKEMHTVEAIGMYQRRTTTEVAKMLRVTVGTLTVAVNNLVRKGYVERIRSENDRRVVKLGLTKRGRLLYRLHDKFHKEMVKETIEDMQPEEIAVLIKGLRNLHGFLDKTQKKLKEQG